MYYIHSVHITSHFIPFQNPIPRWGLQSSKFAFRSRGCGGKGWVRRHTDQWAMLSPSPFPAKQRSRVGGRGENNLIYWLFVPRVTFLFRLTGGRCVWHRTHHSTSTWNASREIPEKRASASGTSAPITAPASLQSWCNQCKNRHPVFWCHVPDTGLGALVPLSLSLFSEPVRGMLLSYPRSGGAAGLALRAVVTAPPLSPLPRVRSQPPCRLHSCLEKPRLPESSQLLVWNVTACFPLTAWDCRAAAWDLTLRFLNTKDSWCQDGTLRGLLPSWGSCLDGSRYTTREVGFFPLPHPMLEDVEDAGTRDTRSGGTQWAGLKMCRQLGRRRQGAIQLSPCSGLSGDFSLQGEDDLPPGEMGRKPWHWPSMFPSQSFSKREASTYLTPLGCQLNSATDVGAILPHVKGWPWKRESSASTDSVSVLSNFLVERQLHNQMSLLRVRQRAERKGGWERLRGGATGGVELGWAQAAQRWGRGQERDPPREPEQGLSWASWEMPFQSRALWGSGDPRPQALNEVSSAPPSPEATQPGVDFEGTRDTCGLFLPP